MSCKTPHKVPPPASQSGQPHSGTGISGHVISTLSFLMTCYPKHQLPTSFIDSGSWSTVLRRKDLPGFPGKNALFGDPYLLWVGWGAECIQVGFVVFFLFLSPHFDCKTLFP